jgi:hypothetical protein
VHHSRSPAKLRYIEETLGNTNVRESDGVMPGLYDVCSKNLRLKYPNVSEVLEVIWGLSLS